MSEEEKPSEGGLENTVQDILNEIEQFQDKYYDPLDYLEPKQVKYIQLQVTTTMSPAQVSKALGVSAHLRRKWDKDPHVIEYKKNCMRQYTDQEIVDAARRQTMFIKEQMFNEIFERFQDPQEAFDEYFGKDAEVSASERAMFMARFAKFTDFDKVMKVWERVDKSFRLDSGQVTERKDENSIEVQARMRFESFKKKRVQRKSLEDKAAVVVEKGMSFEDFQKSLSEEDKEVVEAEFVEDDGEEYEEVHIEEWEIKRG